MDSLVTLIFPVSSEMKYQLTLLNLVLAAVSFVYAAPITHDEIVTKSAKGLRLLQFSEGSDPVWKTDEEAIELMKQRSTFLVPTSYPLFWFEEHESQMNFPPWVLEKAAMEIPAAKRNLAKAFRSGVRVALGTDAGVYPHGLNGGEFWSMVELGLSPAQALQAGTINAAELMGWPDKIGAIRSGLFADIVAVKGDPLTDIRLLQHVDFVMKNGVVYKDEISAAPPRVPANPNH